MFIVALLPLTCPADLYPGPLGSGSLTGASGGITATDGWTTTAALSWELTWNADGSLHYKYTWTAANKEISHFILEVSKDFSLSNPLDYFNGVLPMDEDPQTYDSDGPGKSNPGMPGSVWGLKYETTAMTFVLEFDSFRAPMWGDFYAKDGTYNPPDGPKEDVYAYNAGFGKAEIYDADGDLWKIAVPDTSYVPITGAVLLGMLGLGAAGLRLRRTV